MNMDERAWDQAYRAAKSRRDDAVKAAEQALSDWLRINPPQYMTLNGRWEYHPISHPDRYGIGLLPRGEATATAHGTGRIVFRADGAAAELWELAE